MNLGKTLEEVMKTSRRNQKICSYQVMYNNLNPTDQKALDAAWKSDMPLSLIVRALRQEGIKTSGDSVRAHRKGLCKCPKN